jgi:predicted DNA-binding transcriptional regulator AlpA
MPKKTDPAVPNGPNKPRITSDGLQPRGLRKPRAAAYVGVSETLFDTGVKNGLMPKPFKLGGVTLWDRHQLDLALDALSNREEEDSCWDDVHV